MLCLRKLWKFKRFSIISLKIINVRLLAPRKEAIDCVCVDCSRSKVGSYTLKRERGASPPCLCALFDNCCFLCSPFAYVDPLHCNMAYLYLELLKDSLNEYAYAAELAGLNYDLQNTVYGMHVSIHSLPSF